MKKQTSRDTVFAALKLIEQLYVDGHISRKELLGIVFQNTTMTEYEEFIANLDSNEAD